VTGSHKDVLLKALEAEAGGAPIDLGTLFTDDVVGWSPYASVSGIAALTELAALREVAFSNVSISLRGLDEIGNKAFAEWVIDADHTGPLVLSRMWRWTRRDGTSSLPVPPWPTSARGRSGRTGPTSTTSR